MSRLNIKEAKINYNLKDKLIEKLNNGLYNVRVPYLATLTDEQIRENELVLEDEVDIPTFNQGFVKKEIKLDNKNIKKFDRMTKTNNAFNKNLHKLNKNLELQNNNKYIKKDKSSALRPVEVSLPIMRLVELNENDFAINIMKKSSGFEIAERVQEAIDEIRSSIFIKDYDLKERLEKFLEDVLEINREDMAEKVINDSMSDINDIFGTDVFIDNGTGDRNKYDLSKIKM